jgi:hypothetical protein
MDPILILYDVLSALLLYNVWVVLLILVAIWVIFTRVMPLPQKSWDIRKREPAKNRILKAGADAVSPVGNPQKLIETIYAIGETHAKREGDALIFRANVGWRYAFPVGCAFIFYFFVAEGVDTPVEWTMFFLIHGGLIWLGFYIWTVRFEVEDSTLRYMDMLFGFESQDLANLTGAEDFGDSYVLHFVNSAEVNVPRYLEGHATLKQLIIETLRINGR